MKTPRPLLIPLLLAMVAGAAFLSSAQDKSAAQRYEYAILKWDGPDRIYYNLPGKFEMVHLEKEGINRPRDAQEEEFFLAAAANKMAKEGWEAVNLDSRRILMRRPAGQ